MRSALSSDSSSVISVSAQHIIRFVADNGLITLEEVRDVFSKLTRIVRKRNRLKQRNMMGKVLRHKKDMMHTKYYVHPAKHFCSHLHSEDGV